jgi:polar amino acid transport system substrate-binding protein
VTCLGIDLTERRRAEEALRESEQRVRHKLEAVLDPEGDIGELSLADIVDSEAIGELLDHLNRLTGFAAGLVDPEGNLLVASGRREICTRFHRPHPEAGRNCMYSNRELIRDLRPGSFHMQQCRNHLWDAATPIVMGGRNVGSLFMGQFILAEEEPPPEVFRDQARRFGFDEREYLDALNRVPRWSRETVEAAMAFYGRFASLVSSLSYGALKLARTLEERRRIEEERERLQEELNHAQRMESVGRLAGGVAHDSNNMLNVILGHADMMLESAPEGSLLQDELLEIQRAAQRSADLTRQLLAFARRQPIAPRVLDLNRTVESALRMLGRLIGEHIDLVWNPAADLASVRMDPSQIDQILTNLCVNARDAIGEAGGTVTIRTENAILGDKDCAGDEAVRPGRYVVLGVSDTGGGMGSETMANLFEPFFTTKDTGKGTGLGLPTVFGIVKQNKGLIRVSSEPGQGAHFRIYLPAQTGIAASERSGAETTGEGERTERGTETLLLVEDEPATLSMIRQMLERSGYEVLATTSPEEAIRLADGNADRIRMLITDVVMPGTNGRELAGRLLAAHPHSRQLFMSGYNADFSAERGVLVPGVNFIQKPFSLKDLTAMVRRVLDRPEHG